MFDTLSSFIFFFESQFMANFVRAISFCWFWLGWWENSVNFFLLIALSLVCWWHIQLKYHLLLRCTTVINHKHSRAQKTKKLSKNFYFGQWIFGWDFFSSSIFFPLVRKLKIHYFALVRKMSIDPFEFSFGFVCFAGEQNFGIWFERLLTTNWKNHLFETADVVEHQISTQSTTNFPLQLTFPLRLYALFDTFFFWNNGFIVVRTNGCAVANFHRLIDWVEKFKFEFDSEHFFGYYPFIIVITCIVIVLLSA